jgi:hypothetical protein
MNSRVRHSNHLIPIIPLILLIESGPRLLDPPRQYVIINVMSPLEHRLYVRSNVLDPDVDSLPPSLDHPATAVYSVSSLRKSHLPGAHTKMRQVWSGID